MSLRAGVFLDRDGVLIGSAVHDGKPRAASSLDECEILTGVEPALARLRAAGFPLVVVTNQPDVGTGATRREDVEAINAHLMARLPIDEVLTCYHTDADNCRCRKPKTGLLEQGSQSQAIEAGRSFMVGDRWRDVAAGSAFGCATILVGSGYGENFPVAPDHRAADLPEAAKIILKLSARGEGR